MKTSYLLAMGAMAAALGACGGGGGSADAPSALEQSPASASASSEGFMSYLKALVAASADDLEPVDASMIAPPKDDWTEPITVN